MKIGPWTILILSDEEIETLHSALCIADGESWKDSQHDRWHRMLDKIGRPVDKSREIE